MFVRWIGVLTFGTIAAQKFFDQDSPLDMHKL
jgi:hypothetical protein